MGGTTPDQRSAKTSQAPGPGPVPRPRGPGPSPFQLPQVHPNPGPGSIRASMQGKRMSWPGSADPFKKKMVVVSNESGFMNHVLVAQMALIEEEE